MILTYKQAREIADRYHLSVDVVLNIAMDVASLYDDSFTMGKRKELVAMLQKIVERKEDERA